MTRRLCNLNVVISDVNWGAIQHVILAASRCFLVNVSDNSVPNSRGNNDIYIAQTAHQHCFKQVLVHRRNIVLARGLQTVP
jgi:hypothetical protein